MENKGASYRCIINGVYQLLTYLQNKKKENENSGANKPITVIRTKCDREPKTSVPKI
jgi:hypothetical protein